MSDCFYQNLIKDTNINFCIENYVSNNNPDHHIDLNYRDEGQKEVYEFCKYFMKKNNLNTIIDVGCGS
jgi:hypothetical protein